LHLVFNKEEFSNALQVLSGVASGRNTLPILSNVLIRAQGESVECAATDLDVGITIRTQAQVHEEGVITVNCKKLLDIVKQLPEDSPIVFETTANDRIQMTSGDGVYKIIGLSADEFPDMPNIEGDVLSIDANQLCDVLNKVEFAACKDDVRYFLNGVYFNFLEDKTEVVATDSKLLSLSSLPPYTPPGERDGMIVPLKTVREILKTFVDSSEIEICVGEGNQIVVSDEFSILTSRLVEGEYPNYQGIIPTEHEGTVDVDKSDFVRCVKRVALLSNPMNYSVCLDLSNDGMIVSSKAPELGEATETIAVDNCTLDMRIGFDARLLIDSLNSIRADKITIKYNDPIAPVLFLPTDNTEHVCLVMPLRLTD
jgi:DNA polymerase-3 subunit beta